MSPIEKGRPVPAKEVISEAYAERPDLYENAVIVGLETDEQGRGLRFLGKIMANGEEAWHFMAPSAAEVKKYRKLQGGS